MTGTAAHRVVSDGELNRATCARQLLTEPSFLEPVPAIRQLLALQGQEPASPYLALWTRLADFDPAVLDEALATGAVVKGTLMRMTLHVVAAQDYPAFWAAHAGPFRRARAQTTRVGEGGIAPERLAEVIEIALSFADQPRSNAEMTQHLHEVAGQVGEMGWWWAVRGCAPVTHVPTDGPWSFGYRPYFAAARVRMPWSEPTPEDGLDEVVGRYLAAFGPATIVDIAQFTKLARSMVRESVQRQESGLVQFRNSAGSVLYDIPGAPIPEADFPVPVRFLPMWDSVLLAYGDRSRVIPADVRRRVIRTNGDVLPTFLVDGRVAGIWRAEIVGGRTVIRWKPFSRLAKSVAVEVEMQAQALAAFVEPREPEVYRRYARWWIADEAVSA